MSAALIGLGRRMLLAGAVALALLLVVVVLTVELLERSGEALIARSTATLERLGRQGLEVEAGRLTELLGDALINPLYFLDLKSIRDLARSVLGRPEVRSIRVFDKDGILLHDGSDKIGSFGDRIRDPLVEEILRGRSDAFAWRGDTLAWARGVRLGDSLLGGILVEVTASVFARIIAESKQELADTLDRARREQQEAVLLRLLAFSLLVPLAFVWVSRRVVAPIRRMAERARAIERGQPLPELGPRPPDELGILADALESMRLGIERQQQAIRELAVTDQLTGLPNRRGFDERAAEILAAAKARGQPMAVLFVDLDGFKRVNDVYGHEVGDRALGEVAQRIRRAIAEYLSLEESATLVARLGGDEFVVAFAAEDAVTVAEGLSRTLLEVLCRPIALPPVAVQLGASLGIAIFPDDAGTIADLVRCADLAMYEAKIAGKNGVRRYNLRMRLAVESRAEIELELGAAFERGELALHFQPILSLHRRRPVGAEALLRWNHRVRGLLPADHFWSAIEDSVLLRKLGPWLLREACHAARAWPTAADGSPPFVAVNIAGRQILLGDLERDVRAALAESGLPPERLHLEISERALIADEPRMYAQFRALSELGVQVWLDDFGTGYSGLSRLRQLPLDGVKIDRSFIADLLIDPDDRAITEAIIAMTRALELKVIAEGIESEGHLQVLLEWRCELGQGYWLGRPLPPTGILAMFQGDAR